MCVGSKIQYHSETTSLIIEWSVQCVISLAPACRLWVRALQKEPTCYGQVGHPG